MSSLAQMVSRNRKLFFRDKGMLISSLITPALLIVLYATFLAKVYHDSFVSALPEGLEISDKIINGTVAAQLAAALLAVTCVTVTFCTNLTMVQDRHTGSCKDFSVAPVKRPLVYLAYFISTVCNALMVNMLALGFCLLYILKMGWYLTLADVGCLALDIFLLVLFGTALSSLICYPLRTQGQMSAVGTIVSAGYGFVCGAYMPISSFGDGLQKALSFFPGTYGTALMKNHMLRGVLEEMEESGFPSEVVSSIADSLDCNPVFQGHTVTTPEMLLIMAGTIGILLAVYLLIILLCERNK